jgi:transcriptional regulator with XRE-family HTH domain
MTALQTLRRRSGLSQRALARRAGLAFRTIQLLEAGGHDARWSTFRKLAAALDVDKPEALLPPAAAPTPSAAEAADRMRQEGGDSWKLWLFEFVDAFRRSPTAEAAARPPDPGPEPRLLALLASTVEMLCVEKGLPAPWWCAGVPVLAAPWFVSESENLKASALAESPPAFRKRNIFVLANFLSRA